MNGKFLILGMTLVGAILCSVEAKYPTVMNHEEPEQLSLEQRLKFFQKLLQMKDKQDLKEDTKVAEKPSMENDDQVAKPDEDKQEVFNADELREAGPGTMNDKMEDSKEKSIEMENLDQSEKAAPSGTDSEGVKDMESPDQEDYEELMEGDIPEEALNNLEKTEDIEHPDEEESVNDYPEEEMEEVEHPEEDDLVQPEEEEMEEYGFPEEFEEPVNEEDEFPEEEVLENFEHPDNDKEKVEATAEMVVKGASKEEKHSVSPQKLKKLEAEAEAKIAKTTK